MKKTIFTIFIISMMTGFLITCTLPLANAESTVSDQAQKSVDRKNNIDSVEVSVAQIIEKAEQGDIYAQYDLALMYADGRRVPQNTDQASSWLLKSANGGHLGAQQYLASLYEAGKLGFPKDKDKAKYWSNLKGRLPSSPTGIQGQDDGSKKGISFSVFALFTAFIVFALFAIAFIINKQKIKTKAPAKTETITLDALESQSDSEPESDITLDDLSEKATD